MNLRDALKGNLPDKEIALVPRAFDIVGDVAIIEIPEKLYRRRKEIAEGIVRTHPRVRTVCHKRGERGGEYRISDLEVIKGRGTETVHLEHGCRFKVDVRKAYFSVREATERERIARLVRPGENVLVMFSGVCPSPINYSRLQPEIGHAWGVELNPDAHRYALENVVLNKVQDKVTPICGDVREEVPRLALKFDRITMPLPKAAHMFLDVAVAALKDGGTIHFYHVDREDDPYAEAVRLAGEAAEAAGKKARILDKMKVLPYGPRVWKVCVEFSVS